MKTHTVTDHLKTSFLATLLRVSVTLDIVTVVIFADVRTALPTMYFVHVAYRKLNLQKYSSHQQRFLRGSQCVGLIFTVILQFTVINS